MKGHHSESLRDMLIDIPHAIGCEVGVYEGITTNRMLDMLPNIKRYYTVDTWDIYTLYDGTQFKKPKNPTRKSWHNSITNFFENTKNNQHRIVSLRMPSTEAINHIEDESLDWVFIDANHQYEYIKENLEIWIPKVKQGGLVSGHDYGNPKETNRNWGITKAVDEYVEEFVGKENLIVKPHFVWGFIK